MFGDENASSDNLLNSFSVEHVALKKKKKKKQSTCNMCVEKRQQSAPNTLWEGKEVRTHKRLGLVTQWRSCKAKYD